MATQYDVADAVFQSKTEMLNYEYSTSAKPSENLGHMIECEPRQTTVSELFTLVGAVPTGSDPRLYHLGRFSIATVGFQADNINIGELHVTYQIRLLKPKLFTNLGLGIPYAFYQMGDGTSTVFTNLRPFGIVGVARSGVDNIGIQWSDDGTSLTFPVTNAKLYFKIQITWIGTPALAITNPSPSGSNGVSVNSQIESPINGTTSGRVSNDIGITITGNGKSRPTFTLSTGGGLPTANQQLLVRIVGAPTSIG